MNYLPLEIDGTSGALRVVEANLQTTARTAKRARADEILTEFWSGTGDSPVCGDVNLMTVAHG